jgi:hypothetical protein
MVGQHAVEAHSRFPGLGSDPHRAVAGGVAGHYRQTAAGIGTLRGLTIFVVVMGVILVVGFGAVVAVIAGRMSRGGAATGADQPFPTTATEIPRGARVEAMTTAPNRLILDLILPNGERQLVILDAATGVRLGTIELHQTP